MIATRRVSENYSREYTYQTLRQKLYEKGLDSSPPGSNDVKCLKSLHSRAHKNRHMTSFNPGELEPNPFVAFWLVCAFITFS